MRNKKNWIILILVVSVVVILSITLSGILAKVLETLTLTSGTPQDSTSAKQDFDIGLKSNSTNNLNDFNQVSFDSCNLTIKYLKKDINLEYDPNDETISILDKNDLENSFLMSLGCNKSPDATFQAVDCVNLKSLRYLNLSKTLNRCYLSRGDAQVEMIGNEKQGLFFNLSSQFLQPELSGKNKESYFNKFQIQSSELVKSKSNIEPEQLTKKVVKRANVDYYYSIENFKKYDQCQDENNPDTVNKELISEKYNLKFLLLTKKNVCGMYYFPSNVISVSKTGKTSLISQGLGGFEQEISLSPSGDYLLIVDGAHSGAAYHTSGLKIFKIEKQKIIYTNLVDLDGRGGYNSYYNQDTKMVKWLNDNTIQYSEELIPNTCQINNDSFDDKCVETKVHTVNIGSL